MSTEELKNLNPALKQDHIPGTVRNFAIKVPAEKRPVIALNRSSIFENARYPEPKPIKTEPVMIAKAEPVKAADTAAKKLQQTPYVVKPGDNLGKIANQHNVSIADLKIWNNLSSNLVKIDQKLVVYQPAVADSTQTLASSEVKTTEETAVETKPAPVQIVKASYSKKAVSRKVAPKNPIIIHSVQPGDTLWNISKKYQGISVEEIKKKNNLKTNELKPGQKLVIS